MDHKSTTASATNATTTSNDVRDNGDVRSRVSNTKSKANNTKAIDAPDATKVDSHEEELEHDDDTPHSKTIDTSTAQALNTPPSDSDEGENTAEYIDACTTPNSRSSRPFEGTRNAATDANRNHVAKRGSRDRSADRG
ncbi:MAG: hypothetical protein Q9192_006328 [Flavoplaca navasiana]